MATTMPLKQFGYAFYASIKPEHRSYSASMQASTPGRIQNGNAPTTPVDNCISEGQSRVRVDICVVFLKIGEIDTLKEQYEADVMIKSKWREPALDKDKQETATPVDWSKQWNPRLFIENTIGEPKETAFQMVSYLDTGEAYVTEKRRIKGVFLENLELNDFPFDVQDLTVTVMSERPTNEIELCDDPNDLHKVNKQSFVDEQEWFLYKYIETEHTEIINEYEDPTIKRSAFLVKCRAARRPYYFFWNIFLITFMICSLAFATFAVDRDMPQNRLQLSFTLVLTSVAFKFVVNQSLPKISYLTYLDKYVLAAMVLLTCVCAWHGITTMTGKVGKDGDKSVGDKIDNAALCIFAGGYLAFNIGFAIRIYMEPGRKRKNMRQKEREYTDKIKEQIAYQSDKMQQYEPRTSLSMTSM